MAGTYSTKYLKLPANRQLHYFTGAVIRAMLNLFAPLTTIPICSAAAAALKNAPKMRNTLYCISVYLNMSGVLLTFRKLL
jgi:hypothetical protein